MKINKNKKAMKNIYGSDKTFFTSSINKIKTKVLHYRSTTNFFLVAEFGWLSYFLLISTFFIVLCVILFDYYHLPDFITGVLRILKNLIKKSSSKLKPGHEYIPATPEEVGYYLLAYTVAWIIVECLLFELGGHDKENSEVDEDP